MSTKRLQNRADLIVLYLLIIQQNTHEIEQFKCPSLQKILQIIISTMIGKYKCTINKYTPWIFNKTE